MKKTLKILGIVVLIGGGLYAAYVGYVTYKWRQYLPSTEIAVNGVDREYHLFVPANPPEGPMSLLVLLIGGDASSWKFPQQSQFEELAEKEGIIIAFGVGKLVPPNEGAWQLNTDAQSMQDIDYVGAVIDDISGNHSVDQAEVYAVGYSLGSMFSYELACHMSERFAAIASFAGTMPVAPNSCEPERNVPIMHIHGFKDPIIAYGHTWDWKSWDSVGTMRDVPSLVQYWSDKYNCQNESGQESELATHFVFDDCDQDARIEHYRLADVTHSWPESINGVPTYQVIWSFLSSFTMP